jgi:DNA repair photolyase
VVIVVKVNAPEPLRREPAAPRWAGEHIAMGTNVDVLRWGRAEPLYGRR